MKTIEVELALMNHFDIRRNNIVTNITSGNLFPFEVDLTVLSPAKFAHGFEIKVSKSDFNNDFKKAHVKHSLTKPLKECKHYKMFKYFSYAVPSNLVEFAIEKLPKSFGIYEVVYYTNTSFPFYKVIEKRAPTLINNRKWTDKEVFSFLRLGCMRVYNLKKKILKYEQ